MINLAIVLPCYNEVDVLPETASRLLALLSTLIEKEKVSAGSKIYFIDDGSTDGTWPLIERLAVEHSAVHGIKLSINRGHQNALMAGLFTAEGDALISIDADLQDDIAVIEEMVDEFKKGSDVVYGVRRSRGVDTPFKRISANVFYKVMRIMGADIVPNHADFRLMSRRAVEALKEFREVNLFLRGIVPLVGYVSSMVYYDRAERFAGETKYPLRKMISFALDGITSFSVMPLRIITAIGFVIFAFSLLMSGWIVFEKLFSDQVVPGWASTVLPVYFIGGIQILCIGIIGEYVGKVYGEVKARPRYIIEKVV